MSEPPASRPDAAGYFKRADEGAGLLPWSHVATQMTPARNYWVSTTSSAGRPHSMPVWGVWLEERFWFSTGRTTRKARNLLANPAVVVHLESGADVVVLEGRSEEIRDDPRIEQFLAAYNPKYSWDFEVSQLRSGGLFRVQAHRVFAWRGDEGAAFSETATRWTLDPEDGPAGD